MNLDTERFGTPAWNPFGSWGAARRSRDHQVVNMVRHWNGSASGSWRSVVTYWSVVTADRLRPAGGGPGRRVTVGDAPSRLRHVVQLRAVAGAVGVSRALR